MTPFTAPLNSGWLPGKIDRQLAEIVNTAAFYGPWLNAIVDGKRMAIQDLNYIWHDVRRFKLPVVLDQDRPGRVRVLHFIKKAA